MFSQAEGENVHYITSAGQGQRPMDDETYSVIQKILKGEFVLVADRMKA